MKAFVLAITALVPLGAGSGCCCFWDNVHNAFHCHNGGSGNCRSPHPYGYDHGYVQYGPYAPAPCGGGCDGGCGGPCGEGCAAGCDSGCGRCGGCGLGGIFSEDFLQELFFGYSYPADQCSILGCSSHYLDPQGACYGAYCGSCCEQQGCGPRYWGDYWNVPPTSDPCDRCGNFVGPPQHPHGSTPWYYGPGPSHPGQGHPAHGYPAAAPAGPIVSEEEVVADQKPATKAAAGAKVVSQSTKTMRR